MGPDLALVFSLGQYVDPLLLQLARDENDQSFEGMSESLGGDTPGTLALPGGGRESGCYGGDEAAAAANNQIVPHTGSDAAQDGATPTATAVGAVAAVAAATVAEYDARRRAAEKRDWAWVEGQVMLASVEAGVCRVRCVPHAPPLAPSLPPSRRPPLPPFHACSRRTSHPSTPLTLHPSLPHAASSPHHSEPVHISRDTIGA